MISKLKSKGISSKDNLCQVRSRGEGRSGSKDDSPTQIIDQVVAEIYQEYDTTLRRSNGLDFDDLLLFGLKLFTAHKPSAAWCRHVLVDELWASFTYTTTFSYSLSQDTNVTQYELMKALAVARCVTIVGDPDQSSGYTAFTYLVIWFSFKSLWLALCRGGKPQTYEKRYRR